MPLWVVQLLAPILTNRTDEIRSRGWHRYVLVWFQTPTLKLFMGLSTACKEKQRKIVFRKKYIKASTEDSGERILVWSESRHHRKMLNSSAAGPRA